MACGQKLQDFAASRSGEPSQRRREDGQTQRFVSDHMIFSRGTQRTSLSKRSTSSQCLFCCGSLTHDSRLRTMGYSSYSLSKAIFPAVRARCKGQSRLERTSMHDYSSLADDLYVNMNLNTEMALPAQRETVLGFFERVQKSYPSMRNFYQRENGDFVLEEDKESGSYRWVTIEPRRICSGCVNPADIETALEQHRLILELVPYMLSVSPLDCEALDFMMGFDFSYRGNHDALVAEALGTSPAMDSLLEIAGSQVINYEPSVTIALEEDCRTQCRISIENRTTAYQARTGDFPEEQLSVYLTARQYGSLGPDKTYVGVMDRLAQVCHEIAESHVIEQILRPLQRAIAVK